MCNFTRYDVLIFTAFIPDNVKKEFVSLCYEIIGVFKEIIFWFPEKQTQELNSLRHHFQNMSS
jgi:hypothetical protein